MFGLVGVIDSMNTVSVSKGNSPPLVCGAGT